MEATQSTAEAMAVLNSRYETEIALARIEARRLIAENGKTDTREVRKAMADKGYLNGDQKEFWLGSVFRHKDFVWTQEWKSYSDEERNVHERTVKVWTLRYGAQ